MDVYKCQYFEHQSDILLNQELTAILQSYCSYIIENWTPLEMGQYRSLKERPEFHFRTLITEEIVKENLPELTREEKILLGMETMEIPRE